MIMQCSVRAVGLVGRSSRVRSAVIGKATGYCAPRVVRIKYILRSFTVSVTRAFHPLVRAH